MCPCTSFAFKFSPPVNINNTSVSTIHLFLSSCLTTNNCLGSTKVYRRLNHCNLVTLGAYSTACYPASRVPEATNHPLSSTACYPASRVLEATNHPLWRTVATLRSATALRPPTSHAPRDASIEPPAEDVPSSSPSPDLQRDPES